MELTISKKLIFLLVFLIALTAGAFFLLPRLTGEPLAQSVGFDSSRSAAVAGARAFYSVDYQTGAEVWAASLCAVSTQQACEFYQETATFLWPEFEANKTIVSAEAGEPLKVGDRVAESRDGAAMQVWRVNVSLSEPWPQGDGMTYFPAHIVVVRDPAGWKFERFLLKDEIAQYAGDAR